MQILDRKKTAKKQAPNKPDKPCIQTKIEKAIEYFESLSKEAQEVFKLKIEETEEANV